MWQETRWRNWTSCPMTWSSTWSSPHSPPVCWCLRKMRRPSLWKQKRAYVHVYSILHAVHIFVCCWFLTDVLYLTGKIHRVLWPTGWFLKHRLSGLHWNNLRHLQKGLCMLTQNTQESLPQQSVQNGFRLYFIWIFPKLIFFFRKPSAELQNGIWEKCRVFFFNMMNCHILNCQRI